MAVTVLYVPNFLDNGRFGAVAIEGLFGNGFPEPKVPTTKTGLFGDGAVRKNPPAATRGHPQAFSLVLPSLTATE